jgi:hypothetical protein
MTMTNEQLTADIEQVMDFLCQIVSVESDATFDGLWQKTYYQMFDNRDPIYRADVEKKRLIEFSKDAKLAADIIRRQQEVIRAQHEALETLGKKASYGNEGKVLVIYPGPKIADAIALAAPLVKEV